LDHHTQYKFQLALRDNEWKIVAYDKEVLAEGPQWWRKEDRLKQTIPIESPNAKT